MFSINMITGVELADRLIKQAQRMKRALAHRLESFDMRIENTVENTAEYDAELAETNARLATANALIPTLPEGSELKEEQITEKMELELKLRKLTRSGNKLGSEAILVRELEMDLLNRQIAGLDAFLGAITARKAELSPGS